MGVPLDDHSLLIEICLQSLVCGDYRPVVSMAQLHHEQQGQLGVAFFLVRGAAPGAAVLLPYIPSSPGHQITRSPDHQVTVSDLPSSCGTIVATSGLLIL